jgi:hypothetical protein
VTKDPRRATPADLNDRAKVASEKAKILRAEAGAARDRMRLRKSKRDDADASRRAERAEVSLNR